MDAIDIAIIRELLINSRMTYKQLSNRIELTVPTIHKRVQSLIDKGIITSFKANLGIEYLNAIQVHFLTTGKIKNLEKIIEEFNADENTATLHIGSNDHIHVGGLLKNISELDQYENYIKSKIGVNFQHVGLMNHSEYHTNWISRKEGNWKRIPLSNIDKKIIRFLHTDARKTISDIASEIGYSVKTVRKELDKLIDHHVLEFSINWNPSSSGNIVPFIHIYLSDGVEKEKIYPLLKNRYTRLIFNFMFHNISNLIVSTAWVENLQQLEELKNNLESEEGIEYVKPIIIYSGHHFPTWRDQKLQEMMK